jgi:hypothetical protein
MSIVDAVVHLFGTFVSSDRNQVEICQNCKVIFRSIGKGDAEKGQSTLIFNSIVNPAKGWKALLGTGDLKTKF